jgi:type IV secretory pathway VirB10-like protein
MIAVGARDASNAALSVMIGSQRVFRHGLFISAAAHVGLLAVGLLFLRASAQDAPPPDATLVEIVTPKDIPRFSGTPSELRTSGTEAARRPQPARPAQNVPPQPEQKQQKQQAQAQRDKAAKPKEPPLRQAEAGEIAMPPQPADAPAPSANTADAAAEMAQVAQLALVGGRLGGGFAAPPIDSPLAGYDYTLAFRERVSACAPLPPGIDRSDKISVNLRIFLNRDGTVARTPQLLEANLSAKQQALFENFVNGLQKCQPYTMLPADKYKQWKTLDVMVYPIDSYGG